MFLFYALLCIHVISQYKRIYYTEALCWPEREIRKQESRNYQSRDNTGSVDSNGNINRDIFCEQIFEQAYQDYIDYGSTSHEEWLEYLGIFNFTKDELDSVKDENLYDYYCEGIERFVLEQYNALNNDYHTS